MNPFDLTNVLHRDYGRLDKLLIILASFEHPIDVASIRLAAQDAGLRIKSWNVSDILSSSKGKAVRVSEGWVLTADGSEHVNSLFPEGGRAPPPIAVNLRAEMAKITEPTTLQFVDEAVRCYEAGVFRSAVVMSWMAALDVIYNEVLTKKLAEFNALSLLQNKKWEAATNRDGLAAMKEFTFLERAETVGVITKNEKGALEECLRRRNSCGHPNSFRIGPHAAAGHIETLIQNVFQKYGPPAP